MKEPTHEELLKMSSKELSGLIDETIRLFYEILNQQKLIHSETQ